MKMFKFGLSILALTIFSISVSAQNCSWGLLGFSSDGSTVDVSYACRTGGNVVAEKTIGTAPIGAPSCLITMEDDYENRGDCTNPNVVPVNTPVPPGTKICEFSGTATTGAPADCTRNSIYGGTDFVVYTTKKSGTALMDVLVNTRYCTVTEAGSYPNYTVSGNCNNFRIYTE